MNKNEAQGLVESELKKLNDDSDRIDCVIIPNETIEKEWGWVFFYQSRAYVETGDPIKMLAGNAPIIVNRDTGTLSYTGTAHDIEHYIKEYESTLQ